MVLVIPLMAFLYVKNEMKKTTESNLTKSEIKTKVDIKKLIPVFVIGFLLVSILRSVGDAGIETTNLAFGLIGEDSWNDFITIVKNFANILFVVALGGVGLSTNFANFKGLGGKPFLVGLIAALTTGIMSFLSVSILGGLIIF